MGFMAYLVSLIADIINFNRKLIEDTLQRVTEIERAVRQLDEDRVGPADERPAPKQESLGR